MPQINCQFSEPLNYLGVPPTNTNQIWNYSEAICDFPTSSEPTSTIELIQNSTTGAEFYLRKEINYGEFVIITFLMVFLIFGIFKFLVDFLVPKFINLRK